MWAVNCAPFLWHSSGFLRICPAQAESMGIRLEVIENDREAIIDRGKDLNCQWKTKSMHSINYRLDVKVIVMLSEILPTTQEKQIHPKTCTQRARDAVIKIHPIMLHCKFHFKAILTLIKHFHDLSIVWDDIIDVVSNRRWVAIRTVHSAIKGNSQSTSF